MPNILEFIPVTYSGVIYAAIYTYSSDYNMYFRCRNWSEGTELNIEPSKSIRLPISINYNELTERQALNKEVFEAAKSTFNIYHKKMLCDWYYNLSHNIYISVNSNNISVVFQLANVSFYYELSGIYKYEIYEYRKDITESNMLKPLHKIDTFINLSDIEQQNIITLLISSDSTNRNLALNILNIS